MEVLSENRIGRRILRHIHALAYPRFAGSSGEHRAQQYIRNSFQSAGCLVTEQEFVSSLFPLEMLPRLGVAVISLCLVIAFASLQAIPALAVEMSVLILILLVFATRWTPLLERTYAFQRFGKLRSRNIIALHQQQDRHVNVIFTAHYDSKSQSMSGTLRFGLFIALAVLSSLSSCFVFPVVFFQWPHELVFFTVIPACLIAIILQMNATKNGSPGAFDNASGVAVMLELARWFAHEYPHANLAFIATGAEEAGLCGAVALMQDETFLEQFPPERSIIINLDGIGSKGAIQITDRFGIPPVKTGVLVSNLCCEVAKRFGIEHRTNWIPTGIGMDHIPFAMHGYQAVTISSAGWDNAFRAMHTMYDTADHLDMTSLEFCFAISQEIVESLPSVNHGAANT